MKYFLSLSFLFSSLSVHAEGLKPVDVFLSLSDTALFNLALKNKVGKCFIYDSRNNGNFCDFYAQTSKSGSNLGLPAAYGSGCMVAPNLAKQINYCWGSPNVYDQFNNSSTPICTNDYIKNGANMIRIGLKNGLCDVEAAPASTPASVSSAAVSALACPVVVSDEGKINDLKAELVKAKQINDDNQKIISNNSKQMEDLKKINSLMTIDRDRYKKLSNDWIINSLNLQKQLNDLKIQNTKKK